MDIHIIPCLKDNYAYIVENKKTKNACVIDPSESAPIKDFLNKNKLNLKFILNTHHHADHVGGNLELKKEFNSKILGFEKDKERIPGIDIVLKNRQIWNFENSDVLIEHVPGHTSGHIFYYFKNEEAAFTGDTLFSFGSSGCFGSNAGTPVRIEKLPTLSKIISTNIVVCMYLLFYYIFLEMV